MPTDTRLMALGDYRFSVDTAAYGELVRATEYRWARQDRLGRPPARQYLGPGDDTITLKGIVYPTHRGGLGQVDALREEAGKGEPLRLVGGTGIVFGLWVILRIRETAQAFLAGGAARRQEFEIDLAYYGQDTDGASV